MGRKEVVTMCMESPLYFTMPLKVRLEFIKTRERLFSSRGLRAEIISWVRTGQFETPNLKHCP
jgi:hypothetical protein